MHFASRRPSQEKDNKKMNELENEIDWERVAEQYHAVYDGKTAEERLIIRQMTDAWCMVGGKPPEIVWFLTTDLHGLPRIDW